MKKTEFLNKLGRRVSEIRQSKGMSQNDLGMACGKDRQSINKVEQGKFSPTAFYLHQICKGLGITLKELFDFEAEK